MQSFGLNLLVNFDLLIKHKLTLEAWFLLYCLSNTKQDLLIAYANECNKFSKDTVNKLIEKGFITLKKEGDYSLDSMRLTVMGKDLVVEENKAEDVQFSTLFQQLRDTYPKKVPGENGTNRPLHGDLSRCKRLYQKILFKDGKLDKELHNKILGSITKEVLDRTKGKRLPFMQNLATYLHQQNYTLYFDVDVQPTIERGIDI